jgi:hypothetical protein
MNRRGFFGRTFGALLGAMFPSLFLKKLPGPPSGWSYDIQYGSAWVNPKWGIRVAGPDLEAEPGTYDEDDRRAHDILYGMEKVKAEYVRRILDEH